jgi:serine kinase of HPr protein (carbohydrate metabolism regulator)
VSEWVHGTAVLAKENGILIRGGSGTGKSQLAALLIARGARLIADDRVHLSACHGRIIAAALSAAGGMLELRGRGIVRVPHERSAVIRLVLDIVDESALARLPEADHLSAALLGIRLPRQPVPAAPAQALMLVDAALAAL